MISYEQLCEALDRYNARRRGDSPGADVPAQPTPEMALTDVPAGQPMQAADEHAAPAEELSESIEVDESMIAADDDSAVDQPGEWETVPLTGDLAASEADGLAHADDELPPS